MTFLEHNNRDIAKKNAEYITGITLREYLANKVKKYLGNEPISVFDGAVGSGQLEQFIDVKKLYGCDVQEKAIETCRLNFPNNELTVGSFFQLENNLVCDCVVMNMPFSLKLKEMSVEDQAKIKEEFPWKKSGLVDDIFLLKSLNFTKKYAFHIAFPGICYRKSELKMREILGNKLVELNFIENAFEDTNIGVLFIVIDKEKTDNKVYQERYECKIKKVLTSIENEITPDKWEILNAETEKEKIDIEELEEKIDENILKNLENELKINLIVCNIFPSKDRIQNFKFILKAIRIICDKYKEKILKLENKGE